jgi:hypothetical protein
MSVAISKLLEAFAFFVDGVCRGRGWEVVSSWKACIGGVDVAISEFGKLLNREGICLLERPRGFLFSLRRMSKELNVASVTRKPHA